VRIRDVPGLFVMRIRDVPGLFVTRHAHLVEEDARSPALVTNP
jgi:hypothetical protein